MVLEITDKVRIEPFGVHVWNNATADSIFVDTEVRNYGTDTASVSLTSKICEQNGKQVIRLTENITLKPGETKIIRQSAPISNPNLWSIEKPYLYKLSSIIKRNNKATDDLVTPFGVRTASWPLTPG